MEPENIRTNEEEIIDSLKKRPTGVTILAVLAYLCIPYFLLLTIIGPFLIPVALVEANLFFSSINSDQIAIFMFISILLFFAILTALFFFIGRGLWNGKNWARIAGLTFVTLNILGLVLIWSLSPLGFSFLIGPLAINILIILYLGSNKNAKEYFSNNQIKILKGGY